MTLVIPALTTIQNQLEEEALDLGLSVLNVNKVRNTSLSQVTDHRSQVTVIKMSQSLKFFFQTPVSELKMALEARPQIVLANVDTIANRVVQVAETDLNVFFCEAFFL